MLLEKMQANKKTLKKRLEILAVMIPIPTMQLKIKILVKSCVAIVECLIFTSNLVMLIS